MKIQHLFCATIGIVSMFACSTQSKHREVSTTDNVSVSEIMYSSDYAEESAIEISSRADIRPGLKRQVAANLLTATEINDFKK